MEGYPILLESICQVTKFRSKKLLYHNNIALWIHSYDPDSRILKVMRSDDALKR